MSVSKIKGNREFFGRTGSMLLGRYPDRPAPAHLVNGFISQIIGNSDYAPACRKNLINDNLSEFKAVDKSILNNPKEIEKLGRCLKKAIFNPDGRAWVQIGSLTPIHAALVAYDPSEDGFGSGIGSLVIERDKKIVRHLKKLLIPDPKEHNDIITNLGIALVGKEGEDYNFKPRKKNDFGNLWSKSGSKLGKKFSERIEN